MKFLLLTLALVGSAYALQSSLEYQYRYVGSITTGIPSVRPQVASIGIKTLAIIQMKSNTDGIVKLTDVQSGEFSGDLECSNLRQPVPIEWGPMPQYKEQLEEPFAVSFQEEGDVMKVSQSDVEFITNIRKSVMEALRVEPVVANQGGMKGERLAGLVSGGEGPDAFSLEEETLFGRCESHYTLSKMPEYSVVQTKRNIEKHLKQDEQAEGSPRSSGASVPKLQEQYYRLVRTVDFDKCHDRVILQHTGVGNMSRAGYAQFNAVQSRSSVGTFILKGEPGAFRVESAVIEGDVIANPFGFKMHRIQTITNQTLVLESAGPIQNPIPLPPNIRDVKTWNYEVSSPFSKPEGHPKPWINYTSESDKYYPVNIQSSILGLRPTPSILQEYKKNFLELLETTVVRIYSEPSVPSRSPPSWNSTKESVATTNLYYMTRMLRMLPTSDVTEIFQEVFGKTDVVGQRQQMLLVDIASASGAAAPIHVLLEKVKKGDLSHQRIASIFTTIANNLYSPSIIPELVEYAKSVNIEKSPLLASSVLVNVAGLIERICLDDRRFNYSVPNPIFGKEVCKPSEVMNSFLPYLKQKAEEASTSWERGIVVQAISNLGSAEVVPVLTPYIYGQHNSTTRVRTIAIYGLSKRHMFGSLREKIFDILMEIVDNLMEEPEIRQSAFATLLTYQPDAAWWQRMARLTWREPSQSMAAYISSTIESMAMSTEPHLHRQSRIADFVLPLLKPYSPSITHSYNYLYSRFNVPQKVGISAEFAYIHALRDAVPSELYHGFEGDFGDLKLQLLEFAVASSGLTQNVSNFMNSFKYGDMGDSLYTLPYTPRSNFQRHVEDLVAKMENYVGPKKSHQEPMQADFYLRAFDNIHQYVPVNQDIITMIAGKGGSRFIEKLLAGHTMNFTKFFNPVDLEYFVPTEIGLPVMGVVSMPTMNLGDVEARLFTSGMDNPTIHDLLKAENVTLLFKTNYKLMSKLMVKMEVPAPWSKKVIGSGIDNLKEINLPVYGNLTLNHTSEIKNLTLNLAPFMRTEFPVVYAHNIPYTEIRDYIPSAQWRRDVKVIGIQKNGDPTDKVEKKFPKKYTGLDLTMMYQADVSYPFNGSYLTQYMQHPEYLPHLLTSPTTKQWQAYVMLNPEESTRNVSISLSFLLPSRRSGGSGGRIPAFSAEDTTGQRLEKLRTLSEGSQVYGVNAELMFNGTEFRKYEALLAFTAKSQSHQKKEYKTVLAVMATRIPGYTQSPKALCTQAEFTTPAIPDLEALRQVVRDHPRETVRGQVHYGNNCASPQIVSYQGSVNVSPERLSLLQEELVKVCNYDEVNPVVELQTPAVYDSGSFQIHFSKEKIPKPLLNETYCLQQMIEGAVYPKGYYDNMHRGQQNKISVTMKRPLSSAGYTFVADFPQKRSIFDEVHVPYYMSSIVPFRGLKTSFDQYSNLVIGLELPETCQIQPKQVITYDAVRYDYDPIPCLTTVAVDSRSSDDFIVYSRKTPSGEFEVQVVIPKDHITVVVSPTHATINGNPMPSGQTDYVVKNEAGEPVLEIKKFSDSYQVQIIGKLAVKVFRSEIQVQPQVSMKGYLRGICGDFDGERTYDISGPKGCIYSDVELFKYSWTIPEGNQCDKQQVQREQQKVEEFQAHCPHRPDSKTRNMQMKSFYESKATDCYQHVYPIQKRGPAVCVSLKPVQMCTPQCSVHDKREAKELSKCFLKRNVPAEVRAAESKGYVTQPVTEPAKFRDDIDVTESTDCRKN